MQRALKAAQARLPSVLAQAGTAADLCPRSHRLHSLHDAGLGWRPPSHHRSGKRQPWQRRHEHERQHERNPRHMARRDTTDVGRRACRPERSAHWLLRRRHRQRRRVLRRRRTQRDVLITVFRRRRPVVVQPNLLSRHDELSDDGVRCWIPEATNPRRLGSTDVRTQWRLYG